MSSCKVVVRSGRKLVKIEVRWWVMGLTIYWKLVGKITHLGEKALKEVAIQLKLIPEIVAMNPMTFERA